MSERNNNSSEGQPGHPASLALHAPWLPLNRKSAQIFCYDQEGGGGDPCWTCATFTCFWRNITILFNWLTYLFPRAFWAEAWQSRGAREMAAQADCSVPPGPQRRVPTSLPSSLTLPARAAASNSAHSRGTRVLACLSALLADTGASSLPSSFRCCALKNGGCRPNARCLVILMRSDP